MRATFFSLYSFQHYHIREAASFQHDCDRIARIDCRVKRVVHCRVNLSLSLSKSSSDGSFEYLSYSRVETTFGKVRTTQAGEHTSLAPSQYRNICLDQARQTSSVSVVLERPPARLMDAIPEECESTAPACTTKQLNTGHESITSTADIPFALIPILPLPKYHEELLQFLSRPGMRQEEYERKILARG